MKKYKTIITLLSSIVVSCSITTLARPTIAQSIDFHDGRVLIPHKNWEKLYSDRYRYWGYEKDWKHWRDRHRRYRHHRGRDWRYDDDWGYEKDWKYLRDRHRRRRSRRHRDWKNREDAWRYDDDWKYQDRNRRRRNRRHRDWNDYDDD